MIRSDSWWKPRMYWGHRAVPQQVDEALAGRPRAGGGGGTGPTTTGPTTAGHVRGRWRQR